MRRTKFAIDDKDATQTPPDLLQEKCKCCNKPYVWIIW